MFYPNTKGRNLGVELPHQTNPTSATMTQKDFISARKNEKRKYQENGNAHCNIYWYL
jgi:uncharacterized short protein YbdD (DUF466 family)